MLKKGIIRRITISTMALFILLLYYLFPTNVQSNTLKQRVTYHDVNNTSVYLLNKENYVSRINVFMNETSGDLEKAKEIIKTLTMNNERKEYTPTNFYQVIPEGTEIIEVTLENKLLKIDFTKEFLNVSKNIEKKMVEAIIYSLTELESVDDILLFVEGVQLTSLPNSHEALPPILNKDYGINKTYELDSIKDTAKTTVYYGCQEEDLFYYIPVTFISNKQEEKVEIIVEKLKSSPLYESNLISYLHANTKITDYEILEEEVKLSFNKYLLDNLKNDTILEEVKYTIYLSIRDTYNVNKVEFSVHDEDKSVNLVINSLE